MLAPTYPADDPEWLRVLLVGTPCTLLVYAFVALELDGRTVAPVWLVALGNASYLIYLVYVIIMSALGHLFAITPVHNIYSETLFAVICIGAANAVGLFSYRFIERKSLYYVHIKLNAYLLKDDDRSCHADVDQFKGQGFALSVIAINPDAKVD